MKNIYLLLTSFCIINLSCHKKQNYTIEKDFTFNVGFVPSPKYINTFFDIESGRELLYFGDPVTKKTLKFFNFDGLLIKEVPLLETIKLLGEIDVITVISLDSIVINSLYTNKIVIINGKGESWKLHDLNKLIVSKIGNVYNYYGINIPSYTVDKNNLYLNCDFNYNGYDISKDIVPTGKFENYDYMYNKLIEDPYLLRFNNYLSGIPKIEHFLFGFKKNYSLKKAFFLENASFIKTDLGFLFHSVYSNNLFLIDTLTLKLKSKITIKSDFTQLGIPPLFLTKESYNNLGNIQVENTKTSGYIGQIFSHDDNTYIFVSLPNKNNSKHLDPSNDFSIINYDKNFNRLKEYLFKNGEFNGGRAIMTKKGLIIPKNKIKYEETPIYSLIKFKK